MVTEFIFGYGSNLLDSQMKQRCPEGKFIGVGYINNYRFIYDNSIPFMDGGAVNSIPSAGEIVWGTVYEVNQTDLSRMDKAEEYPITYLRKKETVFLRDGKEVNAYFYYKDFPKIGYPGKGYLEMVLNGAREHSLPEKYISRYILQSMKP